MSFVYPIQQSGEKYEQVRVRILIRCGYCSQRDWIAVV
jgi:hypothetical protein